MAVKFTNNAATTLAAGINSSVTSIAVTDGSVFPTITGSDHFYVTFDDTTNKEIVKVTARSGNTLTVVRGHDNTTARAFSSGDKAELRIVAALLEDVKTDVSSTLTVDTFTGDDSTTAFTLSVAPASEDNLIVFIEGVYQNPGDFTLSGTTLTFDVAPANSRNIIVYHVAALVSGNNLTHNQFTCNGSTTAFTLSLAPIHENNTQVFLNGVYQNKNTYAVSGTTLTLDTAPANGVILEVMSFTQTDVNTLPAAFVSGLTQVTAVGADHFMIFDATDSALKKSLVSDVLESATSISTSADATAITIDSSENVTFTAAVTTGTNLSIGGSNNELRFYEGSNYVGFEAPALTGDQIWVLPAADGSNGQVIKTDGSGNLSFTTIDTSISANSVGITELNVSDGSNGQVLQTNGSGTLSFTTVSSGASDLNGLSDCKTFGTSSLMIGDATTGTIDAANYNIGVGIDIFTSLTTGDNNIAIGFEAVDALTTGGNNVGIGYKALSASNGSWSVAVGSEALKSEATSGSNVAIGGLSMMTSDGASNCTAVGKQTGYLHTDGDYNVWVGSNCGFNSTSSANNVGVGYLSIYSCTTGSELVGIGPKTLTNATTAVSCIAIGDRALEQLIDSPYNVAIGYKSGQNMENGASNEGSCTFVGDSSGRSVTSGKQNTFIGNGAAYSQYATTTGYRNTVVGTGAHCNSGTGNLENVMGFGCRGVGNGYNTFGAEANRTYNQQGSSSWSGTSDQRLKTDVVNEPLGLSFINDLRPVKFKWKKKKDVNSSTFPTIYEEGSEERVQPTEHGVDKHGFLAQELETTLASYSDAGDAGHEIFKQTTDGIYTASPSALIPMLVKALQEADDKIDALTTRIEALEG